ncbi:two-component system response regulator [Marinobacter sp. EhC06]|jgi:two-component system chemotaxis response regulator CheY|uniref:response regulator n=1 Tax=Marinobacter TaxID=2742 RepID=UPI0007D9D5EF|nr:MULTISPECIES: response regulator [unclassified Marinobacter]OAN92770.1 two-component system response regulator [Marinobacter sp. EhN04]OAN96295.1 two-component system response regulator [Marinobacter sp. EhC06]
MSKNILVVDDSASIRQVVSMALKDAGHQVVTAEHGADALGKLDGQRFHLIVSDVNMPVMDGITFVKEVKKRADHKFTPILMLTTESEEGKKMEGKAAGAKAWLVKPFKPELLLAAVSKLA